MNSDWAYSNRIATLSGCGSFPSFPFLSISLVTGGLKFRYYSVLCHVHHVVLQTNSGIKGILPGESTVSHLKSRMFEARLWGGAALGIIASLSLGLDWQCRTWLGSPFGTLNLVLLVAVISAASRQVRNICRVLNTIICFGFYCIHFRNLRTLIMAHHIQWLVNSDLWLLLGWYNDWFSWHSFAQLLHRLNLCWRVQGCSKSWRETTWL